MPGSVPGAWKRCPSSSPEVTIDAEILHVGFDAIDAGSLALIPELCRFLTPPADQLVEAVVALRRQMRGRARGHTLADRPPINDHHVLAGLGELVSHRHSGDTGAHHHDVDFLAAIEGRRIVQHLGAHPQ